MPYHHVDCDGEIKWRPPWPIPPRCTKCNKRWNPLVIYGPPRSDMYHVAPRYRGPKLSGAKGDTSYAKWADGAPPGVALIASRLPNWPRWARILAALIIVAAVIMLLIYLRGSCR